MDRLRILALGLCATIVALGLPFGSAQDGPSTSPPGPSSTAATSSATPTVTWESTSETSGDSDADYDVTLSVRYPLQVFHARSVRMCPMPMLQLEVITDANRHYHHYWDPDGEDGAPPLEVEPSKVTIVVEDHEEYYWIDGSDRIVIESRQPGFYTVLSFPTNYRVYANYGCGAYHTMVPMFVAVPNVIHACHISEGYRLHHEPLEVHDENSEPVTSSPTPVPTWTTSAS